MMMMIAMVVIRHSVVCCCSGTYLHTWYFTVSGWPLLPAAGTKCRGPN